MNSAGLFEHIGPRVEFGSANITNEEAETFRQIALRGLKINKLFVDDAETRIQTSAYTSGLISDAMGDYDVPSLAFYTKSILGTDPDYWRSVITFARFKSSSKEAKIYNIYDVESHGGEVALAARRVRIIRNLARVVFDENGDPYEDVYSRQYKSYETLMTSQDIEEIDQRTSRIIRRSEATGAR